MRQSEAGGPVTSGVPGGSFPATRHSVVRALASSDAQLRRRAFDTLASSYWKPVYKYIRLRWQSAPQDAEDLTQDFFTLAYEKRWLDRYDPARARFRTFLRTCIDGSVANARKAASRLKRGGGMHLVPMDFLSAEVELAGATSSPDVDMEELFRREWIRGLFELALARLRAECTEGDKGVQFALFEQYDVQADDTTGKPTYSELAQAHRIPPTQVTNYLAYARRRFRHHVLEVLAEVTGSDKEFAEEVRDLLGGEP